MHLPSRHTQRAPDTPIPAASNQALKTSEPPQPPCVLKAVVVSQQPTKVGPLQNRGTTITFNLHTIAHTIVSLCSFITARPIYLSIFRLTSVRPAELTHRLAMLVLDVCADVAVLCPGVPEIASHSRRRGPSRSKHNPPLCLPLMLASVMHGKPYVYIHMPVYIHTYIQLHPNRDVYLCLL